MILGVVYFYLKDTCPDDLGRTLTSKPQTTATIIDDMLIISISRGTELLSAIPDTL